jgi:hypothetical protein
MGVSVQKNHLCKSTNNQVHVNDVIIWGDEEARHAYSVYLTNTYRMVILIWMDPAIQIKQHVLNPSHLLSTMN